MTAAALCALTLLLPAAPARAQASGDPLAPPAAEPRPVSLVEAAFRDDDGDTLMLLSDGPLWLRAKQAFRLEPYSGGLTSHPQPGRARFDFVDPRLPGQMGTLTVEPGRATVACGGKVEALVPLNAADVEGIVEMLDPDKVTRPHYGAPRRLLESPGKELAFLTLGDDDSLERRLYRVDCDGERCSVKRLESSQAPGEEGVDAAQVRERRGGPLAGTLVDARDSGKASFWEEALTGSRMPLKAAPATWTELQALGVRQSEVLGRLSTPCDCVLGGRAAD